MNREQVTRQYRIEPDPRTSARVLEPVVLWTSDDGNRRLTFLPHLHENPNDPDACVGGQLRYQRKHGDTEFVDEESLKLSQLRNGEWTKYELRSAATLALYRTLGDLYDLHARQGAPRSRQTVVSLEGDVSTELEGLGNEQTANLLLAVLRHAARAGSDSFVRSLTGLESSSLWNLSHAMRIAGLRKALDRWEELESADEPEWQRFLKENPWILAQAFAQPVVLFRSGGGVSPQTLSLDEQQLVDFVYTNTLSRNLILVEIKTARTELVTHAPYRGSRIYAPSRELVGAVAQISAYRHSIKRHALTVLWGIERAALRADPVSVVVVGNLAQLDSDEKIETLEQYRRELRNVEILTFDELRARAKGMLELLDRSE